jgi:MYXO-CTERM domain-containing protein
MLSVMTLWLGAPAQADAQSRTCYSYPFPLSTISSPFGAPRSYGGHAGTDFAPRSGASIPAIASGVVALNRRSDVLGNVLVIRHPDGMHSGYSHMLSPSRLAAGTRVERGQIIGQVGNTGSASMGAHLHLTLGTTAESYYNFRTIDPVPYIRQRLANAQGECGCEGDACGVSWLNGHVAAYAPARTTDVNGDGRADICGRGAAGLWCHMSNGAGFDLEPRTALVPMASADEWKAAKHYATIRMGDIDGDGRADVCGRGIGGIKCWASEGDGSWAVFDGPPLSDAAGWSAPQHYTTLRLADVNGDGKDDLCARAGVGLQCWPSTGRGFGEAISGPAWSNDSGYGQASRFYGTLRFGDINGDGKDDACIRNSAGYICAPSNGAGFDEPIAVAPWSDEKGWGKLQYWGTIQLLDFNGDGKADVCARSGSDLRCVMSQGTSFGDTLIVAALSDASGWDDMSNWATLRVGDLNGDGRDDLCARANSGMRCWSWDGSAVTALVGEDWSDDRGWSAANKYATIRMADLDGDGMDDMCTRSNAGVSCHLSTGAGFAELPTPELEEFKSASGWTEEQYWATLQLDGPRCSPERCNGRDDDCDGLVDDDPVEAGQACDVGADPCVTGLTACVAGVVRCEPMRASRPECADVEMGAADMGGSADMDAPDMGAGRPSVEASGDVGCACGAAPSQPGAGWLWALLFVAGVAVRRRVASVTSRRR